MPIEYELDFNNYNKKTGTLKKCTCLFIIRMQLFLHIKDLKVEMIQDTRKV